MIGNTEYKKVKIDNAKHLIESMYSAGFRDLEIIQRKYQKDIDAIPGFKRKIYFQQE